MSLDLATWIELLPVLRENFALWSAGMKQGVYKEYLFQQINHTWARRHFRYVIFKENGRAVSSCKLYEFEFASRGQTYSFLGIGAVFTLNAFRGRGYATKMLEEVIELARSEERAGLLLFSDIGNSIYTEVGFEPVGALEFAIYLEPSDSVEVEVKPHVEKTGGVNADADACRLKPAISEEAISEILRIHSGWLRRQPFGIVRNRGYLNFKLGRERYLHLHSNLSWPTIQIKFVHNSYNDCGYALFEQSGAIMRVFEVIGSQNSCRQLWQELYEKAVKEKIKRIRGWEGAVTDFAPGFKFAEISKKNEEGKIFCFERDWGVPMLMTFKPELENWDSAFPCPLLEIDHF